MKCIRLDTKVKRIVVDVLQEVLSLRQLLAK